MFRAGPGGGGPWEPRTFHAEDGRFVLEDVPEGRWTVEVSAEGFQSGTASGVVVEAGGRAEGVEIALSKGGTIRGQVVEARSGRPLPDATVQGELSGGVGRGGRMPLLMGGGANEPMGIASGDFVFVGDLGRPDLLESAAGVAGAREPSARRLYESTKRFLNLDDHVQVWPGHGAGSACGKALGSIPQSTVGYERRFNAALGFDTEDGFVASILEGQPEPPIYFARMKDLNKNGVPVLGDLPAPKLYSIEELAERGSQDGAVIVDTRSDRKGFMAGHVPGSLHAPLGINFAMIVGSYVDPSTDIYLIVEGSEVDEAVRTLVRLGYDNIAGFVPPSSLVECGLSEEIIKRVDFHDLERDVDAAMYTILDVRGAAEYAGLHVPGAINIAHTRLANRLAEVPKDKPVLTYCRTGNRAAAAAALLAREGYDVTLVDGELAAWPGFRAEGAPAGVA